MTKKKEVKRTKGSSNAHTASLTEDVSKALDDLKGIDIKVIDVTAMTDVTDYMIVVSGTSSRHVKSLANNVVEEMLKLGIKPHGVEGMDQGEWVLVDLVDVVVHVMQSQARQFYEIERLWSVSADNREARTAEAAPQEIKAADTGAEES
ncbi:MAG: ribosome-associated protein [Candidatus Pseudothioglobus sp.]|jgi:ribosome-associated protein